MIIEIIILRICLKLRNEFYREIELKLKECTNWETLEKQEMFCFSATGSIWNTKETDLLTCGQILDDIAKYIKKNEV